MSHHNQHAGLQRHSVGEIYPWSIVVIDNAADKRGYCISRNLVSGENLVRREYDSSPDASDGEGFERAHALAENDARQRIARDKIKPADFELLDARGVDYSPARKLTEIAVLIPEHRDDNSLPHTIGLMQLWDRHLVDSHGGFTRDADSVRGVWRSPSGERIEDRSTRYRVAVADVAAFLDSLKYWAKQFGQQCLYTVELGQARLIWAS